MPEQKITYLQRVVIMAKRIQKASPLVGHWTSYKEAAIAAVSAQAEAIREAMWKFYEDGEMRDDVDDNMLSYLINEHLNSNGYIEPKTEGNEEDRN